MITIRHAAPGQPGHEREFATDGEASAYARSLPETEAVRWEGKPERADPPLATRAMWTGTIAFGMVTAPVRLYTATEDGTPALHQFCKHHGTRLRMRRWCDHGEGHELASTDIVRGIETAGGPATVTPAELVELREQTGPKAIAVEEFVPAGSVPAVYHDRTYYIAPDKQGRRPYDLLAETLRRTRTVAIGQVTMRERRHLCMVRAEHGRLVLVLLHWPSEVRSDASLPNLYGEAAVNADELGMARLLVRGMRQPIFDANRYHDPYAEALNARLDAKTVAPPVAATATVIDLMAKLRESVDEAKRTRTAAR